MREICKFLLKLELIEGISPGITDSCLSVLKTADNNSSFVDGDLNLACLYGPVVHEAKFIGSHIHPFHSTFWSWALIFALSVSLVHTVLLWLSVLGLKFYSGFFSTACMWMVLKDNHLRF